MSAKLRNQHIICFVNRASVTLVPTSCRAEICADLKVITEHLPLTYCDKRTGEKLEISVLVKDWRTDECLSPDELPAGFCAGIARLFYDLDLSDIPF